LKETSVVLHRFQVSHRAAVYLTYLHELSCSEKMMGLLILATGRYPHDF
jgi:hypothetical protein